LHHPLWKNGTDIGANGGFARYRLTIEPWTRFLSLGRDSRLFQDMTVCDILDAVMKSYDGKGRLAPAWRFDLQDRGASVHTIRSKRAAFYKMPGGSRVEGKYLVPGDTIYA
jgi:uncharacterized protein involved in type VI secretion and phage assembly